MSESHKDFDDLQVHSRTKKWGYTPEMLHLKYIATVRPMITYGAITCADRSELSKTIGVLHKLRRLASVCINWEMRTFPKTSLKVLLGLISFRLHTQMQARRTIFTMSGIPAKRGAT